MAGLTAVERLKFVLQVDASGGIKAFEKFGHAADKELSKVQNKLDKQAAQMQKYGAGAVAFAGTAGIALFKLSTTWQQGAIAAGKFAAATGITTEEASRFIVVAQNLDLESGKIVKAMGKMEKALGGKPEMFRDMGIATLDAAGKELSAQEVFLNSIDVLNKMEDQSYKSKKASSLFGRDWQNMAVMIGQGSEKLRASFAAVRDDQVFGKGEVNAAYKYRDALKDLGNSFKALKNSIGAGAAPMFAGLAGGVTKAVDGLNSVNKASGGAVGNILATGTAAIGTAGALAFAAGSAVKARDKFSIVGATGVRSLTNVGKAALGAGVLVAGFALVTASMAQASQESKDRVDAFAASMEASGRTAEEQAKQTIGVWLAKTPELAAAMTEAGLSTTDLYNAILQGGNVLQDFQLKISDTKKSLSGMVERDPFYLTQGLVDTRDAYVGVNTEIEANVEASQLQGETEKELADRVKEVAAALDKKNEAQKRAREEAQSAREEALRGIDAESDLRLAQRDTRDAMVDYKEAMHDGTLTALDRTIAADTVVSAIRGEAEAFANSKHLAEGSKESIAAQIAIIDLWAQKLQPGNPLLRGLQDLADKLRAASRGYTPEMARLMDKYSVSMWTPKGLAGPSSPYAPKAPDTSGSHKTTTGDGLLDVSELQDIAGMATGGVAKGGVTLVGEQGPELVMMAGGEHVLTAAQTKSLGSDSGSSAQSDQSLWAAQLEMGDISAKQYKQLLSDRLNSFEKYSSEYMSIWREIRGIDQDAENASKAHDQEIRNNQDAMFELGEISVGFYKQILKSRLSGFQKYSSDYMSVYGQIRGIEKDAADKSEKDLESAQQFKEAAIQKHLDKVRALYQQAENKRNYDEADFASNRAVRDFGQSLTEAVRLKNDRSSKVTDKDRQDAVDSARDAADSAANALLERASAAAVAWGFAEGTPEYARSVRRWLLNDETVNPNLKPAIERVLSGIPQMAMGGLVTSPQIAMIGEAGPEAVIPLSKVGQMGATYNITVNTAADPNSVVAAIKRYTKNGGVL